MIKVGFGRKLGLALRKIAGTAKAKQYEAGLRNEDLSLTDEAKDLILNNLAESEEVSKLLTDEAEAILEEQEKENK